MDPRYTLEPQAGVSNVMDRGTSGRGPRRHEGLHKQLAFPRYRVSCLTQHKYYTLLGNISPL
jgi:hypothetical protein